ncbi:MAG: biotin--[acetyl-CoA-carboxylase] ligase [Deltaproteobacteria bacterium]|nr:biotin--[acetyl-CoA-carboxylase] ligase [Deltaproteobacteria bacterium]
MRPSSGRDNLIVVEAIGSTQKLASRFVREYTGEGRQVPEAIVIAYQQTAGRGRHGRSWSSPAGAGVFVTLLRRFPADREVRNLPLLMAVSLAEAIEVYLGDGDSCQLKWPNDLLIRKRKVGGILIDIKSRSGEAAVGLLGFGINHSHRTEELPAKPSISLADCAPSLPSLAELTDRVLSTTTHHLTRLEDQDWLIDHYRRKSVHALGDRLTCKIGERYIDGEFIGFDRQGSLRLKTEQGEECVTTGEIFQGAGDL